MGRESAERLSIIHGQLSVWAGPTHFCASAGSETTGEPMRLDCAKWQRHATKQLTTSSVISKICEGADITRPTAFSVISGDLLPLRLNPASRIVPNSFQLRLGTKSASHRLARAAGQSESSLVFLLHHLLSELRPALGGFRPLGSASLLVHTR